MKRDVGQEREKVARRDERSDTDVLAVYRRDIGDTVRLSREDEIRLATEMANCRADIRDRLLAVLVKAIDVLGLDPARRDDAARRTIEDYVEEVRALRLGEGGVAHDDKAGLRARVLSEIGDARLNAFALKIEAITALAHRQWQYLRHGRGCDRIERKARAQRILDGIRAGYGVSAEEIDAVVASIVQLRERISAARTALVEANLRLVVYVANRSNYRSVDVGDLIQEGNIALMRAAETYDPNRGFAFATFACLAIRRAIHRFADDMSKAVHVPNDVRARRRRVQQTARHLAGKEGQAATWQGIAEYLDVPMQTVVDALGSSEATVSFDQLPDDGNESIVDRFADARSVDSAEAAAEGEWDRMVERTIAALDERDRRVLSTRFGLGDVSPATLAELGRALGVTRERARQLEARALRNLRCGSAPSRPAGRRGAPKRRSF